MLYNLWTYGNHYFVLPSKKIAAELVRVNAPVTNKQILQIGNSDRCLRQTVDYFQVFELTACLSCLVS